MFSRMSKPDLSFDALRRVHDTCLCFNLQRAARAQARRYDRALRPSGLTNGQFSLMMMLMRPHRPTIGTLANELSMDRTTLTALLKPLRRRGFIETSAAADDSRRRELTLTPEGRRVVRAAWPLWQTVQEQTKKIKGAPPLSKFVASLHPFL